MSQKETNDSGDVRHDEGQKSIRKKEYVDEYKLVPMDEYESDPDEQYVDTVGILKDLWVNRRFILVVTIICFLIGLVIYTGSERIYYSEAKLVPETNTETSQLGQVFRQAESIFGIQRTTEEEGISVAMYPYIVESLPFQIDLMQHEVFFSDINSRVTIFEYFTNHYQKPLFDRLFDSVWNYTFGLPATLMNLFSKEEESTEIPTSSFSSILEIQTPIRISSDVRMVSRTVNSFTTIDRDPLSGFVNVGVSFTDPQAATEMVILVKNLLQEYVTDYRTEKANRNLQFIEERYVEAKVNFEKVQDSLAAYQDRNVNIQRQTLMVQEERLQFETELAFALYNNIGRRLQEAKIQVQEETPVFRIHEPATVPTRPASPRASRLLGGSIFVGFFLGIVLHYARRSQSIFIEKFNEKDISYYTH